MAHPAIRDVLEHFSTTYPASDLLPLALLEPARQLVRERKWSSVACYRAFAQRAPVLHMAISLAAITDREHGLIPEWFLPFLRLLVAKVADLEGPDTTPTMSDEEQKTFARLCSYSSTGYYYPSNSVVRKLEKKYKKDTYVSVGAGACPKYSNSTKKFMPGVLLCFCLAGPKPVLIGYHILEQAESPRTIFNVLFTRWQVAPKKIIYGTLLTRDSFYSQDAHARSLDRHTPHVSWPARYDIPRAHI